ncbi:MAG: DUF4347 domain-containing protein [Rhizomicrobium sp.]
MTIQFSDDLATTRDDDAPAGGGRGSQLLPPGAGLSASPLQVGGDFVFIDSRVPDIQDLVNGVQPGNHVFVINPDGDGLQQIADILAANGAHGLSGISIVSHGSAGEIEIGSTILNDATLADHAGALSAIGAALKSGGDLSLFSCNTASGIVGQQFIGDLSSYVGGADVAAATHTVGGAAEGGSFLLDAATGAIDDVSPFTAAATDDFDGSLAGTISGQLWYGANGGGVRSTVGHVNSDTTSPTQQGNESDSGEVQAKSVGIDLAAGLYFQTDDTNNATISSYNYSTGNVISTLQLGSISDGDIVNALAVDPLHNTIYVGRWGADLAHSGLIKLTYNPATGVMDSTAAFNGTPNFIVHNNAGVDDIRGIAVDDVNQVIYFSVDNDSFNTGGFNYTNGLWRVNADGTGLTELTTAGQFAASNNDTRAIGPVAFDAAKGLVYFETSDVSSGGTGAATLWEISASASGGTANQVTLPGGTLLAYGDTPQGGLAIDPQTQQIYITVQSGTNANATDQVLVGQLASNGLSVTSIVNTYSYATLDGQTHAANEHITGTAFDTLPVLSIAGTTTHAVEQSSSLVLRSSESSADADSNHYAGATVQITGGTFTSNENSTADDHLFVQDGATQRVTGTISGTNITVAYNSATETLTLSGYDTIAHYDAALAAVTYNTTGDNPTNYGSNTTRTITWTINDGALNVPTGQQNSGTTTLTVDGVNDAPVLANSGTVTYTEQSAPVAIDSTITVSDVDNLNETSATITISAGYQSGDMLIPSVMGNISGVYNTSTHVLTLSGSDTLADYQQVLRSISFQNTSNNDPTAGGTDTSRTVTFTVNDGSATSNTVTATINITAVDDAPTATAPGTHYAATEQTPLNLKGTGLSVGDVDGGSGSETLTISVGEGTLTATAGTSGATLGGSGTGSLTISGSIAQINAFLNTDGTSALSYSDGSDTPAASTTLSLSINDGSNTGTGGPLTGTASSTIDITAVNDAPTISPFGYTATEQTALNLKNTGVTVGDVDAGSGSETLTVNVGEGTLTGTAGGSGATVAGSGSGTLTISGTIAQINAFLSTDATSTFSYIDNTDTPSASTGLSMSLNDHGNTGTGGPIITAISSTITIIPVNDPPTLTATGANTTFVENGAVAHLFSSAAVSAIEPGDNIADVVLTVSGLADGANEVLGIDDTNSIPLTDGTTRTTLTNGLSVAVSVSGGIATVTLSKAGGIAPSVLAGIVDGLIYADNGDAPTPGNRVFTLTSIQDTGGTAHGGQDTTALSVHATIGVVAANDAPTATAPGTHYAAVEQTALSLKATGLSVGDVDGGSGSETLTISVGEGTLTGTAGGSGATIGGSGTGTLTVSGSIAQIDAFLASDGTSALSYIDNTDTPSASTTLSLSINDNGNSHGAPLTGAASATIDITPVNDAPTLTAAASNPSFREAPGVGTQAAAVTLFSGAAAGTIESGQTVVSLTFTVSGLHDGASEKAVVDGTTFALTSGATGTTTGGNGLTYAVSGTAGAVTVTLTSASGLSAANAAAVIDAIAYQDTNTDAPTAGGRVFTLTSIQDSGGTANGGHDTTTLSIASTVTVATVNDPPTGTSSTITTLEDTSHVFGTAEFGFSDPTDNGANTLLAVKIVTLPSAGTLTDNGVAVTAGQFIPVADIAGGLLAFTPAANANGTGYASFTFQVQDNGGTANGGGDLDPTPKTITVDVTPVNDAPTGTSATVTTLEDTAHAFSAAEFGFSDPADSPANTLLAVKIVTLPSAGTLTDNGVAVTAGQFIPVADIAGGHLVFTPAANANGTGYASFTFQVQDNGGTANGGSDLDPVPKTITVDVTPVNDAPVLAGAGNTIGYTEQAAAVALDPAITVGDVDNTTLASATVTISAGLQAGDTLHLDSNPATMGNIAASYSGGVLTLTSAGDTASLAQWQAALRSVTFNNASNDDPTAGGTALTRTITWQVDDGQGVNHASDTTTTTIDVTAVDDPAVAASDDFTTTAAAAIGAGLSLLADNGHGADGDVDGPLPLTIAAVNGAAGNVGTPFTLASGAHLTVNADGTFAYDPNHAFDTLASASSGAANSAAADSFTYTLTGGGTAAVTVTVTGADTASTVYIGDAAHTHITGGDGGHLFDLTAAADYTATGGAGDDGFAFGATFDGNDAVNGGGGGNNQMQLDGNYAAASSWTPPRCRTSRSWRCSRATTTR